MTSTARTPLATTRARRATLGSLTGLALGVAAVAGIAAPASAVAPPQNGPTGASVSAVSALGDRVASPDGETTLTLSGTGFQSVDGGFGGIYVLFGWVADGAWQPSNGGGFGSTYQYQPDTMSAENSGYQKFVTFPGSSTAGEANGSELALDGTWDTELIIPGPVLTVTDAAGAERQLDCRVETCGVITFGAHGVTNANNEAFTPISFEAVAAPAPEATPEATPEPTTEAAQEPSQEPTEVAEATTSEGAASAEGESAEGASDVAEETAAGAGSGALPWVIGGAAVLAAGAAAFVVKRRRDDVTGPTSGISQD